MTRIREEEEEEVERLTDSFGN